MDQFNQFSNIPKKDFSSRTILITIFIFIVIVIVTILSYITWDQQKSINELHTQVEIATSVEEIQFPHCVEGNTAPHCLSPIVSPSSPSECLDASQQVISTSPLECVPNNIAFPDNRITDECFDWHFPDDIEILRYDPCSSLSLFKYENGREFKANFVLSVGGSTYSSDAISKDVIVNGSPTTRYLLDLTDSDDGLGKYKIDYSIYYDPIPLKSVREGKKVLRTEFQLATKNSTHVSKLEANEFVDTVDIIMNALVTR